MNFRELMNRPFCYRRDGTPYPYGHAGFLEWARDHEKIENRLVALDALSNGVEVSTVWLGLDHNYSIKGRPLIFESMLFVPQHSELLGMTFDRAPIGDQWRYSTEDEALRGHKMLVKKWSKFRTAEQVLSE